MVAVFIGEHENKLDSKYRLSIPAEFRRELEKGDPEWQPGKNPSMVVVYGDQRRDFLEVYTIADHRAVMEQIFQMPRGSAQRVALQKMFASQSAQLTLDETGRAVLPARIRDKLDLSGSVTIVGFGDTFQMWNPDTYAQGLGGMKLDTEGFDPEADPSIYLPGTRH